MAASAAPAERTGGCLCGAVRYAAATTAEGFDVCHCKMCQRWVSGPFFAVEVAAAAMRITGGDAVARFRSSDRAERAFCRNCGAALWYRLAPAGDGADYEIALGTLDDPGGLTLRREIFCDRKPGSYALAGDHPRETEAETLARHKADAAG
ncbi:GFA family protein [Roseivivax sp. CAU 1761]